MIPDRDICELLEITFGAVYGKEFMFFPSEDKKSYYARIIEGTLILKRDDILKRSGTDRIKFIKRKYIQALKNTQRKLERELN